MKIKEEFVLQEVADEYIVVPVADEAERLHGIIKLNETGAFIWKCISQKDMSYDEIEKELVSEYSVSLDKAASDLKAFIEQIRGMGCLEE